MRINLSILLITLTFVQVAASGYAQGITLNAEGATLEEVFQTIKKQTNYVFMYSSEDVPNTTVSVKIEKSDIHQAMEACLAHSPFTYKIVNNIVLIKQKGDNRMDNVILENLQIDISGTVRDEAGEPLSGATVLIKGTSQGVTTDENGLYRLSNVSESAVLVFTYLGYQSQEISVNNRQQINVSMTADSEAMDEVIVVGYGTQKRANLTGAVASVDFEDIENVPQANTVNILSGRLPGVSVVQGGGQPGDDQGDVTIRGIGTLNDASPLVIIDGVQSTLTDMGNLSPQEIDNVSVLKDASSAAIYGSRGANGVILVTTKLPKTERINLNLSAYTAWQEATYLPQMVESWQYMALMNEATSNIRYSQEVIDTARLGIPSDNIANTKWFDEIFITAPMQNYHLSINGKTKGTSFQLSGGIMNQEGILRNTRSDRYTIRGNVQTEVNKFITAGLNVWGYNRTKDQAFDTPNQLINQALHVPIMPVRYANGEYAVYNETVTGSKIVDNPVLNSEIGFTDQNILKINVQPSIRIKLAKGLNLRSAFTYSYDQLSLEQFNPTYSYNSNFGLPAYENKISSLNNTNTNTKQMQWQSTLTYDKDIDKHSFKGLIGHEILEYSEEFFRAQGDNLPSNDLPVLDNASANFLIKGNKQEWALQSFFGRVNYDFDDRFLLEANLRADGSSRFNGIYRFSPSASAGWLISKEDFFDGLRPALSFLKLRVGYGKLGNDRIGNYTFQQVLKLSGYYTVGDALQTAASINSFANPDITWEQTATSNIGLDVGLLNNLFFVNFDIYNRLTDGILFQLPLPLSFGSASSPFQNIAKVSNKGFDLAVEHKNKVGQFGYRAMVNFSYNQNNVEKLNDQRVIIGNANGGLSLLQEGSPINSWFGYESDGLYTQEDEDSGYPKYHNAVVVGSIKFNDINNDGVINAEDRKVIGDGTTPYTFGLSGGLTYKGFDFSFLAQGIANKDIYIYDYGNRPGNGGQINFWKEWWTRSYHPERNPDGDWPIIKSQSPEAAESSSYFISNASYVRLKNVELGFTVPKTLLQRFKINQMRLYVSGQNLLTLSSVPKNLDPERSNFQRDNRSYPQTRILSIGLNASF